MAVKVIVKGDSSGNYEFLVKNIRFERCCYDEQIVELLDSEGNLLYTVPQESVILIQYIQDDANLKLQEFVHGDYITQICFDNNLSDATIDCTRVNAEKIMDSTVIDVFQYLGINKENNQEIWFKEFTIPIKKLKFINHNYLIDVEKNPTSSTPTQEIEPEVVDTTPNVDEEKPKKHKSRFNKK